MIIDIIVILKFFKSFYSIEVLFIQRECPNTDSVIYIYTIYFTYT